MTNASTLSLIMMLLVGSVAAAAQSPGTGPDEREGTKSGAITGRVVNESGQPLPNATVYVRGPATPGQTTVTDAEGNFQVSGLDPTIYIVSASAPTYVQPPRDPDNPSAYYRVGDSVSLSLTKGGVITGTVTSASGEPLVQIGVRAIMVRDANGKLPQYSVYQQERLSDDRGIYRIYGLVPGAYVVAAGGGRSGGVNYNNPYDSDAPTYAPSSTRDTAVEVIVRAGEEATGADIRYRSDPGHTISGTVISGATDLINFFANITLTQVANGVPQTNAFASQGQNQDIKGFAFHGLADGDYDLTAQSTAGPGDATAAEPQRITVKGSDVTGIELAVKPLASISGHLVLVTSTAPQCVNKRRPLFGETFVNTRRNEVPTEKDRPRQISFSGAQATPNQTGEFVLRNLAPGQYSLTTRFFAKYWYLQAISSPAGTPPPAVSRTTRANRSIDLARNWLNLKSGERVSNLTVSLAEGAASLRGTYKRVEAEPVSIKRYLHLVPAEKEKAEDVLRFFATPIDGDGGFTIGNLPPGRYWLVVRDAGDDESLLTAKLRLPDGSDKRVNLRTQAEAAKTEIEFKPCQNVTDYQLRSQ